MNIDRREFLSGLAATGALAAFGSLTALAQEQQELPTPQDTRKGDMVYRPLGRTGEQVSLVGLGGFHFGTVKEEKDAIALVRRAIDRGITFMDNCWDYHDGKSEIWMGKALRDGYRDKVFLMSKIDGQTRTSAAKQIDESLLRLGVDHVDLMQYHEVIRPHDPDVIFGENGAHQSMLEAQKAGKVRFIGFTGHKDPFIHLRMLQAGQAAGFRFDAVQMPLNVMDAHFRSFQQQVLPELVKQGIGVLGMKSMGAGDILKAQVCSATECLHYAMSLPVSTVITGIDKPEIFDQAIEAAKTYKPMSRDEMAQLLDRTRQLALTGRHEKFKTSLRFDGTSKHPEWLGKEQVNEPV